MGNEKSLKLYAMSMIIHPNRLVARINQWRYRLIPYIQNIALDVGLLDGHQDYARFIILGRSRSGSNFLRGLLNAHSRIIVLGELFQNQASIGWAYPGYMQNRQLLSLFRKEPVRFLESKVFKRFPKPIKAVGFKIFYYHAQNNDWIPVWDYLIRQNGLKVIHIKRNNILRTHLSRKLAALTDTWIDTTGGKDNHQGITLEYEECLRDFVQTREWEQAHDRNFSDHEILQITYEDLAHDYAREMARLQDFLGVTPEEVKPQTFKQSSRLLSQSIVNYDELKERFSGTSWESFFDE